MNLPELPEPFNQFEYAILTESGEIQLCSLQEWAEAMETKKPIAQDYFLEEKYFVSTVFLGLNTSLRPEPDWFETMVFGPAEENEFHGKKIMIRPSLWSSRCATLPEALIQHQQGIAWLKANRLESQ